MVTSGDITELRDLVNAPQYNGCRGVALGRPERDQDGILRYPIRLFNCNGKVLQVKENNLQQCRDLDEWRHSKIYGISLMEMIKRNNAIGGEDNCYEFASKLWGEMAELGAAHILTVDHYYLVRNCIMEATGCKLYWLAMDAIGHHMIIEKCHGSYRVYQGFVAQLGNGYTASEWCFGDMRKKPAWNRFGGGKIVGADEINYLLDMVIKWQKLTGKLLQRILLDAVPGLDARAKPHMHKSRIEEGPNLPPVKLLVNAISYTSIWSDRMISRVGLEGCSEIKTPSIVKIYIGYQHILSIPTDMYNECDSVSRAMTGEPLLPCVFLFMLNSGGCWESRQDDNGNAIGFTFRGMDMDLNISREEGVRRANEMTQRAKECGKSV